MVRRADLIFRTQRVEKSLQLSNLKWFNVEEAFEKRNGNVDFFVSGTIVKIHPLTVIESDGWNLKDDPMSYRLNLVLKDLSPNPSSSGKDHFLFNLYGTYAKDFETLSAKEGEIVTVTNPNLVAKRSYLHKEEDGNFLLDYELVVGLRKLVHKVCLHSELPIVQVEKENATNGHLVEEIEMTVAPRSKPTNPTRPLVQKSNGVQYTILKDCIPGKRHNTWGIVTKITRFPTQTRKPSIFSATVFIEDPESRGSYGYSNYQFSILGHNPDEFPPIELHSIMRIHHCKTELFNGEPTFRVFEPNAVTVFKGAANDPIVPISTKKDGNVEVTASDVARIKEIRSWWSLEARKRAGVDPEGFSQQLTQDFSKLNKETVFDLTCKVLHVVSGGAAIIVTDGLVPAVEYQTVNNDFTKDPDQITIFVKPKLEETRKVSIPKEGCFVHLREVYSVQVPGGLKLMSCFYENQVQLLTKEISSVKEIVRRLENRQPKTTNDQYRVSDDTLNALLAPIESQTTSQGSHPYVTVFPSNMESLNLEQIEGSQQTNNSDENTFSQQFFTCPEVREKLSPSPERDVEDVVKTDTNFAWTSIEELESDIDENITYYRIHGYVRKTSHSNRSWKQSLCMVCPHCCNVRKYDANKIKCADCPNDRLVTFHFVLTLEEYMPDRALQTSSPPKLNLFLAGKHAEDLLKVTAEQYSSDAENRKKVTEIFQNLIDKPATFSISRASEMDKNYGYQIVYSYFVQNLQPE